MKRFVITLVLLFTLAAAARAQYYPPDQTTQVAPPPSSVDLDEFGNPIQEADADSAKKVKIRKPLESYFFDDSIKLNKVFRWQVDTYRNRIRIVPMDTAAHSIQPHFPITTHGEAWQGNLGGAVMPLDYTERPRYANFSFAQGFDAYNIFPETALFYNGKTPLTQFSYYMSGQTKFAEEGFYISHSQNISPSSGFNIDYRSQGTRGRYNWSKGRDKNLSMAFSHTGRNYTVHAGYIYNTANNKENGGVVDDRYVTDTIYENTDVIPVKLHDARNVIKGNTAYVVQSYGFPLSRLRDSTSISGSSSIFVGHSFEYSRWTKLYTDTRAQSVYEELLSLDWEDTQEKEFYEHWYLNRDMTMDSISESLVSNRAFIQIQPYDREGIIGLIDVGVGVDAHGYYMFRPMDYLTGRREPQKRTDYYAYGAIDGKVSRYFDWEGNVRYHPAGGRRGDFDIGGQAALSAFFRGRPVTLSGRFNVMRNSPTYWDENLVSNHFMWTNDFDPEDESRLQLKLNVPSWSLEIGAMQSVVTNKIYYDATARPAQQGGTVSVTGAYVDKIFSVGGWRFKHRVLLQQSSSQSTVPVPLASAYVSYSFEFDVVRDVLHARIGLDGYYNTPYYAPGWMPATARLYNQREKEIGGYPLIDAYVSAKWKRMRILLKMEHVNDNLFGTRNYFTMLHYPLNKRIFKMGITWSFYD